ncbi:MAG: hypothetical protein LBN18_00015 [Dysgonamonadaceae bacterium]|jgi:hypothetical protein|nr:hypothetical protein [Dysgonamonadaceae bacterium]
MALVGNPYMSSLDFSALYNEGDNANHILESYQIWTGEGFTAYTPNGSTGEIGGIALDQYIAPMQSFIVEKTGLSDNFNLEYKVANVSVARPNTSASLRNAGLQALNNKLEILASTPAHTILAFIAHRENGDVTLCPQDSRKLLLGISDTPEVYTLKNQASGGSIGVGANVINTSDITIPLALATTYQGNIQLTFNGMNTYNAQIKLIDYAENQEILLTGDSYTYSFNYTPAKVNSKVVANEERFAIQFSPNAPTGVDRPETAQASVYCKDHTIYALASPSDPIREIAIYNGQGQCLYVEKNIRAASRSFAVGDRSEVYLVKLITEKGVKNVKLINK